jgi:hypothetical protein
MNQVGFANLWLVNGVNKVNKVTKINIQNPTPLGLARPQDFAAGFCPLCCPAQHADGSC